MADTVTTQTIADTQGVKFVAKLTNFSDGTGESLVKKIDASEVTFMTEDATRKIAKIWYSINVSDTKSAVELVWDGETNSTAAILSGNGYWDLRTAGNEITNSATTPTGDVLLSTKNFALGDNYTIIVEFR
nr:hypothetical protein [uncultured Mediterranean phage uvMED]|tara:strand:+ start:877 stop:1269 length:393 start_codon:yes stop_codon:yes gene_type:complete